jgi:hypothetical protein
VTIGTLIRVSFTLCRNDLFSATKAFISSFKEDDRFDFSFRTDNWYFSNGAKVIFVALSRNCLKQGMDYFCNMYNGNNNKVPNGQKLVFFSLYQVQLTPEIRDQLGHEQRVWQDSEVAAFVQGFRDLVFKI